MLLLGVADVKASKRFYVDRGLAVGKSFGSKYVEFDLPARPSSSLSTGAAPPPRTRESPRKARGRTGS